MFAPKYYDRYLDDHFDRQHYGARLKLKKFDTEEFQSLSNIYDLPTIVDDGDHTRIPTCIDVRDVSFHYNSYMPVLSKVSLQVPQGKIYALLGASGCGKTTLLRMILGRLKPLSGSIRVFGFEPGSSESNIPGAGVGYMPQELALFHLLTIDEVLHYYGRLYDLSVNEIDLKVQHFIDFLNLPSKDRKISQLSGGQQRRVSLAVTMIHEPPLLILDEPTVGVDSLLRCRIWNYLENICQNQGTTVLITTHYTEEARNAFRVGFVDSGIMLAQDNPERLIAKYCCVSLEDVFLELCLQKSANTVKFKTILEKVEEDEEEEDEKVADDQEEKHEKKVNFVSSKNQKSKNKTEINLIQQNKMLNGTKLKGKKKGHPLMLSTDSLQTLTDNNSQFSSNGLSKNNARTRHAKNEAARSRYLNNLALNSKIQTSMVSSQTTFTANGRHSSGSNRLSALLRKNYILFKRNPVSIILLNILPIIQIGLYCISFERNPKGIPIAVVNRDNRSTSLSNLFLKNFDDTVRIIPYKSVNSAIQSVRTVDTWLAISFPRNFSRNFRRRFTGKPELVSSKAIEGSKIALYPDNTHAVFALYTFRTIIDAFEVFVQQVGGMMGMNPAFFGSPIQLMPPVYGTYKIAYGEYIAAGMITCIVHGMTMLIASFTIVRERNEGHLERGFVAGIRPAEIILSHIIFLLLPVLSQVLWVLGVALFYFQITLKGSMIEVFIFAILAAFQGLLFGIGISVISPTEVASLILVFIVEMPLLFTSGTLYPLESLPNVLHTVMLWNPLTLPINSLRNIMLRDWTLANIPVLLGLVSSISYSIILTVFTFGFFQILNH